MGDDFAKAALARQGRYFPAYARWPLGSIPVGRSYGPEFDIYPDQEFDVGRDERGRPIGVPRRTRGRFTVPKPPLQTTKKGSTMKKSDALIAALAAAVFEEKAREEKYGEEGPDGTVVRFTAKFVKGGREYGYAAVRAGRLWYTTGPNSPKGFTWDQLTSWLDEMHEVIDFDTWPPKEASE